MLERGKRWDEIAGSHLVFQLCHHSEKLAVALGLINTAPSSPLRIKKSAGFLRLPHFQEVHLKNIEG
jgi:hypothetical protein